MPTPTVTTVDVVAARTVIVRAVVENAAPFTIVPGVTYCASDVEVSYRQYPGRPWTWRLTVTGPTSNGAVSGFRAFDDSTPGSIPAWAAEFVTANHPA